MAVSETLASNTKPEPEIIAFESRRKWFVWLAKHHTRAEGIWLRFYKKGSGVKTITYAEALDGALCYGWIDGQGRGYDSESHLRKFTPRRPRSPWSKINTGHAERLMASGEIEPPGLAEIERAKADGRWARAYASSSAMTVPDDFLAALRQSKKATAFFGTLNKRNTYAIAYRLQDAKRPETRARRISEFVEMLERGEKLY